MFSGWSSGCSLASIHGSAGAPTATIAATKSFSLTPRCWSADIASLCIRCACTKTKRIVEIEGSITILCAIACMYVCMYVCSRHYTVPVPVSTACPCTIHKTKRETKHWLLLTSNSTRKARTRWLSWASSKAMISSRTIFVA